MEALTDTKALKSQIDLQQIAERYSELRRWSAGELAGACPRCGGTDRFHVRSEWWKCYQCHEKPGDAIELVQWLGLATGFRESVSWLDRWRGGAGDLGDATKRKPEPKRAAPKWQEAKWQEKARELVNSAAERLAGASGESGAAYLVGRGIEPRTWQAWRLGLADVWQPRRRRKMPAIIMPYTNGRVIKAVQYRFIGADLDKGERFSQLAGGERTLFGAHMIARREILAIVEGEINAVSLWQAAGDVLDVVSVGSEDNTDLAAPFAAQLAERYALALVWADKPEVAHELSEVLGRRAVAMQSPVIDGAKLDANEVLKRGFLRDLVLTKLLEAHLAELAGSPGSGMEFAEPGHEAHATYERFCTLEALKIGSENDNSEQQ